MLQGSFRLCNWLSSRRLVSWINHLPPACRSTFWKSNFKQQLGCRFDIMDNESYFLCFDIYNYICLDTSDHFSVLPSWIFFIFSSTLVLTSSCRRSLFTFYWYNTKNQGRYTKPVLCGKHDKSKMPTQERTVNLRKSVIAVHCHTAKQ